jgi:hypothetical protein
MQCFGKSVVSQETAIILEGCPETSSNLENGGDSPSLLLVDWYTGGRENMDGGPWQLSSFHTKTTISYSIGKNEEEPSFDYNYDSAIKPVFHDATRLSGGKELRRHMRDFRIVAMIILIGPKVEEVASKFMKKYSSRRIYDDDGKGENFGNNPAKTMDYNKGDGLNRANEGLLVSCGKFNTCKEGKYQTGVVVRLASNTLEKAGMLAYFSLNSPHPFVNPYAPFTTQQTFCRRRSAP